MSSDDFTAFDAPSESTVRLRRIMADAPWALRDHGDGAWLAELIRERLGEPRPTRFFQRDELIDVFTDSLRDPRDSKRPLRSDVAKALEAEKLLKNYFYYGPWKSHCTLIVPPATYTQHQRMMFAIAKECSEKGPPSPRIIRLILQKAREQKPRERAIKTGNSELLSIANNSSHVANQSSVAEDIPMIAAPSKWNDSFLEEVKRTPFGQEVEANASARIIADRQKHFDEIQKLEAGDEAVYLKHDKRLREEEAAVREVQKALKMAIGRLDQARAAKSSESHERTYKRRRHEMALLETAENEAIDAFIRHVSAEWNDRRGPGLSVTLKNPRTGKIEVLGPYNSENANKCIDAWRAAQAAVECLRLEPDQRTIPARLQQLREALPKIVPAGLAQIEA